MSKINTLLNLLKAKEDLVGPLGDNGFFDWLSDENYLKLLFKSKMGTSLNLNNPRTFNEKIQWLKLYDRREIYTDLVDKLSAKTIVGSRIGKEHIVSTYKVWETAEDITVDDLPDKFVLKCNHDQGSVILVEDKRNINLSDIKERYKKLLKRSPYNGTREYPYKNIKRKVFAEEYLTDNIIDYKFYCFNGNPLFLYCGRGLTEDHSLRIDFFDMDWNRMPFYRTDYHRLGDIQRPKRLNEMIEIAKMLSKDTYFVRIDLFEVDDKVYFSEYTLYPASGLMPVTPEKYDRIIGDWLTIPAKK